MKIVGIDVGYEGKSTVAILSVGVPATEFEDITPAAVSISGFIQREKPDVVALVAVQEHPMDRTRRVLEEMTRLHWWEDGLFHEGVRAVRVGRRMTDAVLKEGLRERILGFYEVGTAAPVLTESRLRAAAAAVYIIGFPGRPLTD